METGSCQTDVAARGYCSKFLEAAAGWKQPQAEKYVEYMPLLYWIRGSNLIQNDPIIKAEIRLEPDSILGRIKWLVRQ
jgi:hypothetical protein